MYPRAWVWPREAEALALSGSELGWDGQQKAGGLASLAFTHFFAAIQTTELSGSSGKPSFKLN